MNSKALLRLMIIYLVPYAFIALMADFSLHIMWGWAVMGVVLVLADIYGIHNFGTRPVLLGNALSGAVSYVCCIASGLNKRTWFFKPFTSRTLTILVTVLALVIARLLSRVIRKPGQ